MRTHPRAILLRLTEADFFRLKQISSAKSLTMQELLRDLLRYGVLPETEMPNSPTVKKRLDKHIAI